MNWKKLPNKLVQKGAKDGWLNLKLKIKKSCTISITEGLKVKRASKRASKTPVQDGFTIGGFEASRSVELAGFEE